jgi:hypothetical protein
MSMQIWYLKQDQTVGTYTGVWFGPVQQGRNGPYQRLLLNPEEKDRRKWMYRSLTLSRIVKVTEDGRQVWPIVKPAKRDANGRFAKAE